MVYSGTHEGVDTMTYFIYKEEKSSIFVTECYRNLLQTVNTVTKSEGMHSAVFIRRVNKNGEKLFRLNYKNGLN